MFSLSCDHVFQVGDHVIMCSLSGVHNVFHVSMLRKYVPDPSHVVDYEPLKLKDDINYENN